MWVFDTMLGMFNGVLVGKRGKELKMLPSQHFPFSIFHFPFNDVHFQQMSGGFYPPSHAEAEKMWW